MTDVRKSLRLPADLAARIDAARGFEAWSSWVKRALESALGEPERGPSGITREMWESPALAAQFRESPRNWDRQMARTIEIESTGDDRVSEPFYDDGETPDG